MRRIVIAVLSLAVILGFLFWRFGPNLGQQKTGPVVLTYWGLWEDENIIRPVLEEYQKNNPNIQITYKRQSSINYRTRVQTQVREGVGPDVFMIHNSWLPMFEGDLASAPDGIFPLAEYRSAFYPVAEASFVKSGQIFAVPTGIDGLALYYNEELLSAAGVGVPKSWQEFVDAAVRMTVRDSTGQIRTAGAALGSTGNVDHWPDILGLLLLQQPNVNLTSPATEATAEVFRFYTGFITDPRKKVWDVTMASSTQAFIQGRLAFYFAPSWRAFEIRQANPQLRFNTAPVPQLAARTVGWGSFWGLAVSGRSPYQEEAWRLAKFLTSAEAQRLIYTQASQMRLFGQLYSQVSLAPEIAQAPVVGGFVKQAPYYKFWYLSSNTFDAGINDEMIKYWEDGINATLAGIDPQVALQTVAKGVQQVLDKYTKLSVTDSPR